MVPAASAEPVMTARLALAGSRSASVPLTGALTGDLDTLFAVRRKYRSPGCTMTSQRYSVRPGGVSARLRVNGVASSTRHSKTAWVALTVAVPGLKRACVATRVALNASAPARYHG